MNGPGLNDRSMRLAGRPRSDDAICLRSIRKVFPGSILPVWLKRSRAHHGGLEVLEDITLTVRAGEVVGLIGRNGAGKTTLLEVLATVLTPTRGDAKIGGYDVVRDAAKIRTLLA